jgi:hypothetical protein
MQRMIGVSVSTVIEALFTSSSSLRSALIVTAYFPVNMPSLPTFQAVWLSLSLRDVKLILPLRSELAVQIVSSAQTVLATGPDAFPRNWRSCPNCLQCRRKATPLQMVVVPTDVPDPGSIASLSNTIMATYGRMDLLLNNADISTRNIAFEVLSLEQ